MNDKLDSIEFRKDIIPLLPKGINNFDAITAYNHILMHLLEKIEP